MPRPLTTKQTKERDFYLRYKETFAIFRNAIEGIIVTGYHPDRADLDAYLSAETQPLSPTVQKYLANNPANKSRGKGRPYSRTVGEHILRQWVRQIYDHVHEATRIECREKGWKDPTTVTRERIAESVEVSPATVGRYVKGRKVKIKK